MQVSRERVFEVLSDHAGYARFPGVRSARLLRPGTREPNGEGALRRIHVFLPWFEELITAFDRPRRFEYRIQRSFPGIAHQGGSVTCTPASDGTPDVTEVVWTTTFEVALPLIGGIATLIASWIMNRQFAEALRVVEELARAE